MIVKLISCTWESYNQPTCISTADAWILRILRYKERSETKNSRQKIGSPCPLTPAYIIQ